MEGQEMKSFSSIIFVGSIAEPDLAFLKSLEKYALVNNITLINVIMNRHDLSFFSLPRKNTISIGSDFSEDISFFSGFKNKKIRVVADKKLQADSVKYLDGISRFKSCMLSLTKNFPDSLFIINNQKGALFRVAERLALRHGVGVLRYNRWYLPESYIITDMPFFGCNKSHISQLVQNKPDFKEKYTLNHVEVDVFKKDIITVLLCSDDIGFRSSGHWINKPFKGWESQQKEIINALIETGKTVFIRPHPNAKGFGVDWIEKAGFTDASNMDLELLLSKSERVICTQTSMYFKALTGCSCPVSIIGTVDNLGVGETRLNSLGDIKDFLSGKVISLENEDLDEFERNNVVFVNSDSGLFFLKNYLPVACDSLGNVEKKFFLFSNLKSEIKAVLFKFKRILSGLRKLIRGAL
ncbi:MAG: hypothetical protein JXR18_12235 [Neptuniibacter sp.]